ncbi:heparan-alpha-glucosaminide N-acetyltransferase [Methanofollis ethanolicus]|uniref:heparan-alpha-glucosaminide N-acetyltransferase n=1 Tax=Methanofollis ethanolicus TaxID=488124 RepID=UPI00082ECA0C|nr:heparan-alpha-glucosaminide N-acetyltransferase [Methanofollis ethanolicus]
MNVQPYARKWGEVLSTHSSSRRFREIDLLRGIAIVMMVAYHLLFDLWFFGTAAVDVLDGFWRYFALATATLFIALAGLSLPISYERRRQKMTGLSLCFEYGRRGGKVFLFGMLATLATWIFLGEGFIVFGILHLIGFAIITAPFFLRFGRWNLFVGAAIILAAVPIGNLAGPSWLIPLGIPPAGFYSVDYVPIVPWLGVALIGMAIGFLLYPGGRRRFGVPAMEGRGADALCMMGRNSLAIYLLHQPVIVAVLLAARVVTG